MDRRTILAVVVSVVIIGLGFWIQSVVFKPNPQTAAAKPSPSASVSPSPETATSVPSPSASAPALVANSPAVSGLGNPSLPADAIVPVADSASASPYIYDNGTIRATIDPSGANLTSLELLKYQDEVAGKRQPVQMIFPGENAGLVTRFGDQAGAILSAPFNKSPQVDKNVVEFYHDFYVNNAPAKTFTVTKRYTFYPNDYLFELDVEIKNSANEMIPLNFNGTAYTLSVGPQIGPLSSRLVQNQDYRRFVYLTPSGRQTPNVGRNTEQTISEHTNWVAVDGKYFSFFILPGSADFKITFATKDTPNHQGDQLYVSRPVIQSGNQVDKYRIYAGPKLADMLSKYNKAEDNPAGQSNLNMDKIVDGSFFLISWLEVALKAIMQVFYWVIPNWGISIILLTILIKVVLYPLTKRSMESTARMGLLAPKMTELRAKYKDNPTKLNAEMAALYKTEKINPLGGCLPILLQFPFFFAMYALFNNHFDLRGALFIPGWINDLSVPESVWNFGSFHVPFLNWNDLRLLPLIYLGTQLASTKFTQATSPTASTGQMKIMMYGLPAVFFFILYETPSGLLVYWIFQNILSVAQQVFVNRHLVRKNLRPASGSSVKSNVVATQGRDQGGKNIVPMKSSKNTQNAKVIKKSK